MLKQEKFQRDDVLKELGISDDTLALYEHELEINTEPGSSGMESFTSEDFESIKVFHNLRESGLTYNEIKLLSSFSEVLKNVDFAGENEIKNLLNLSPVYRLKQSLNLSKQELSLAKSRLIELEEALKKEIENRTNLGEDPSNVKTELGTKQKTINNLDGRLSEALQQKVQLESELELYKSSKGGKTQIKSKKAKELYKDLVAKEEELSKLNEIHKQLIAELDEQKEESAELRERIEFMEDGITEMEHEIEERYQEQIDSLKKQIESLIEKKQKEWESFYVQSNDQHRKELLTLQRKHEQEIMRLKYRIKEQIEKIEELKMQRNPLIGLLKMGSGQR